MVVITYNNIKEFILSSTLKTTLLSRIDLTLAALSLQQSELAARDEPLTEFELNDGQTKIRCNFSTAADIDKAINSILTTRNRLINMNRSCVRRGIDESQAIGYVFPYTIS